MAAKAPVIMKKEAYSGPALLTSDMSVAGEGVSLAAQGGGVNKLGEVGRQRAASVRRAIRQW